MEMPVEMSGPTGPRGGTHRDRGSNVPTPRYHRYHVTHAGPYSRNQRALSGPNLTWASVSPYRRSSDIPNKILASIPQFLFWIPGVCIHLSLFCI